MCSQVVTDATCLPCVVAVVGGSFALYVVGLSLFVFGVMRRAG
jgi:hypothetical protein